MKKQQTEASPGTVKLSDLAEWSGFTERHLRDLSTAGNLPPIERGELPFEAVASLFKYLRRDSEELIRQKLLKVTADRKIAEIEAETAAGRFKSVEVFNHHLMCFSKAISRAIYAHERPLIAALKGLAPNADEGAIINGVQKALDAMLIDLRAAVEAAEEEPIKTDEA